MLFFRQRSVVARRALQAAMSAGCIFFGSTSSQAAFVLVDNFDGLSNGAINGQNGWTSNGTGTNSATVAADPANAGNKVLAVGTTAANLFKGVSIPDNSITTLYYQIKRDQMTNFSTGASGSATPADFANFEVQLNVNALSANPQPIRIRDAAAFDAVSDLNGSASNFATAEALHVFHVINTNNNTSKLYIQESSEGAPVLQVNGSQQDFAFRNNATATTLSTFFIRTGSASATDSAHIGPLFVDNIYLDSAENLVAPAPLMGNTVPEPSTSGMLGVAAIAMLARRRRA